MKKMPLTILEYLNVVVYDVALGMSKKYCEKLNGVLDRRLRSGYDFKQISSELFVV